jgi:hypothetical protein
MVVQAMLRPPFDYILSYDPLLQLTIYPDPLLPFTLFIISCERKLDQTDLVWYSFITLH